MRLYLSSFRLGSEPHALLGLLKGGTRVAVITNAADYEATAARAALFEREYEDLTGIGLQATELDLRRFFNRPTELRRHLARFDLMWVRGGNSFVLRRALQASGADSAIKDLLSADAVVYGGYSAGSCMMTPSLHGIQMVDDPDAVPEGYTSEVIWDCLGILPFSLLPHYKSDHPESPLIDKSMAYMIENHIPFIALRDGQALVRNGDLDFVVG